jgi:hypothetical protein
MLWCNSATVETMSNKQKKGRGSTEQTRPNLTSGRTTWAVGGFFLLLAALFYAPVLSGLRSFPDGDFAHHFFPFSLYQHQQLAAGRLALWNPYTYSGHPFLADVQAALFYPISNLLLLLTLPLSDAAARFYVLEVEAVLHTALAGMFAYLWTRDLTGSRWAGLVGGISFALSGYVTGYAPLQLAVLRTAVWLPLLLWTLGRGWQQPRQWRWWLGSTVALACAFLAGHSQSFMLLGYASVAWVIFLACFRRTTHLVRVIVGLWVTLILSITLTAAQWLPSVEFVGYSVRAQVDYDFVSGGLAFADFWQLLLPRVLTQYSPLYIGVIGIVLVMIALFSLLRPNVGEGMSGAPLLLLPWRAGIGFCFVLALFALLASLGGNGPLYPLLYRIAPGWSWFRGQERAAYLVAVALSGLAAYGMAALPALSQQMKRRGAFAAGALIVAAVYAFGLLWQLQGRTAIDHAGYLLIAVLTLVLGLGVALLASLPGWSARRSAWIVALVVVNLVWANAGTNQAPGSPAERVRLAPEVEAVMAAVDERADAANGLPGRVYNEYRVYDDYGMQAGVEDVWGSSPLRVARYAQLFDQFPLDRMWRLMGVEHVLTWRRELFGPSTLLAEFPQATDTTYLHRLPEANPRAWLVSNFEIAEDETVVALLADHQQNLDEIAWLGAEYSSFAPLDGGANVEGEVNLSRRSPEVIDVSVRSESDALLVVSEVWMPGWKALDAVCEDACPEQDPAGRAFFNPMRANLTLIGIWVPAGSSAFTLRYDPISVRLGLWISGVTLLVLALLALWRAGRRAAGP